MNIPAFTDPVGRFLGRTSWVLAILGALIITGLAVLLVVTIFARKMLGWQVTGDHELVRMFGAAGVSMMLPWCHLVGGNVVVDLLTVGLPKSVRDLMDRFGSVLLAAVMLLLAWRTGLLAQGSQAAGSFSPMLAWPVWIFQVAMIPGLLLTGINALYVAVAPGALAAREQQTAEGGAQE